jgi:phosphoribosyl 1,2-cyclic phosphodiesterase
MRVRFWGVRGTIPTPGFSTARTGGNTACIDLLTSDQQVIILDAGTGIRKLGQTLLAEHPERIVGTLLISHTHWDHIQGFPFFTPAFARGNRFVVIGQKRIGRQLENVLAGQVVEPYLPFAYDALKADLLVKETRNGDVMVIGDETVLESAELDHPGSCLGFRITNSGTTVTYCTDTTHRNNQINENVLRLARNADLLIHDAQYTPSQKTNQPHFGHSSWLDAVKVAQAANVKMLALFHHDPETSDEMLIGILEEARSFFPNTVIAREGMVIHLPVGVVDNQHQQVIKYS